MAAQSKILLLDDDPEFLELYQEMLSRHLPSFPEVKIATSGPRAISLLESEPFNLLSVDLNMPKMDGLQVLSIARRKFPQLRLVVLTGIRDEQFRNRAYALGVDQYWVKPESDQEIALLMEAFEALLSQEAEGGFRGLQSKSLVDIIQLECLSQSSSVLRITNGRQEAKIWIQKGEVIDAEFQELTAEVAFQRILGWRTGTFEILPPDAERPRTIFTSYQGLLLNTAQAIDEEASILNVPEGEDGSGSPEVLSNITPLLAELAQMPGVDFILSRKIGQEKTRDYFGLENPDPISQWSQQTWSQLQTLGDSLHVGELQEILAVSSQRKIALLQCGDTALCVGLAGSLTPENTRDILKSVSGKWAS